MSEPAAKRKPSAWLIFLAVVALLGLALLWSVNQKPKNLARIVDADPALQKATNQARSQLPHFKERLSQPKTGERFAILARLHTSQGAEFIWVRDPVYVDGAFHGYLGQSPAIYPGKIGDPVSVDASEVYDWMIQGPNGTEGDFTESPLRGK